jgi:hypothetical protein
LRPCGIPAIEPLRFVQVFRLARGGCAIVTYAWVCAATPRPPAPFRGAGRPRSLALSLFGFNVGVELGQLAIVGVFRPAAFWLRGPWTYRRVVLGGGSALIAAIAGVWLVERAFNVTILPMAA